MAIGTNRSQQYEGWGWKKLVILVVVGAAVTYLLVAAFVAERHRRSEHRAQLIAKWINWESWRDANCRLIERRYGQLTEKGGSSTDNAEVFSCSGGVAYVVFQSVTQKAYECKIGRTCQLTMNDIPN